MFMVTDREEDFSTLFAIEFRESELGPDQ